LRGIVLSFLSFNKLEKSELARLTELPDDDDGDKFVVDAAKCIAPSLLPPSFSLFIWKCGEAKPPQSWHCEIGSRGLDEAEEVYFLRCFFSPLVQRFMAFLMLF
jgi:hypothetical protein